MLKNIKKVFILKDKSSNDIDEIDVNFLKENDKVLSVNPISKAKEESSIVLIYEYFDDEAVVIDGKFYSLNNMMFVRKNNIEEFIPVNKIDTTYEKYLVNENTFSKIHTVEKIEAPINIKSFKTNLHNNYICGIVVLRDQDRNFLDA